MGNAQSKVRLRNALEAVGDMGGIVVESLQAELAKARCLQSTFRSQNARSIERSERRLVWLEADCDREGGFVRGASPLGQIGGSDVPPTEARVDQLMEEISQLSRSGGWQVGATIPKEFAVGRILCRCATQRCTSGHQKDFHRGLRDIIQRWRDCPISMVLA